MPKKSNKNRKLFSFNYRYIREDGERDDICRPAYLIASSYINALKKIISLSEMIIKENDKENYINKITDIEISDLSKLDAELYFDE